MTNRDEQELGMDLEPRYPQGTPEYDAYAAELCGELAKFAAGQDPYPYPSAAGRAPDLSEVLRRRVAEQDSERPQWLQVRDFLDELSR